MNFAPAPRGRWELSRWVRGTDEIYEDEDEKGELAADQDEDDTASALGRLGFFEVPNKEKERKNKIDRSARDPDVSQLRE